MAGFAVLKNPKEGFTIQLQPWSAIKGRIVDAQGEPLKRARIGSGPLWNAPGKPVEKSLPFPYLRKTEAVEYERTTDEEGRFEIHGLVSGFPYKLNGSHQDKSMNYVSNVFAKDVVLKTGEMKDLGSVVLKKMTPEEIKKQTQAAAFAVFSVEEE